MIRQLNVRKTLFILFGSAITAFGLVHFNMQNKLAEGGFTGITLLLYFLFKWDPSYTNLILNLPLFVIGWKLLGKKSFIYTIIGTVSVSVFLWIFQRNALHMPLNHDLTLAALFAGVFSGIGLGIIFRNGGTTGGVDIIARIVQKYFGWSMGKTMFMFDASVITLSLLTYLNYKQAMYTLVAVFVSARVIDFIQEGAYAARGAMVVSESYQTIAEKIMSEMDRGVTILNGYGYFTKQKRDVIYCVVAKSEIAQLKNLITSIDPYAFISISAVYDVHGEGFTLDENKKPIT